MITLTILCILYTIFGLLILKKQQGNIELTPDAPLWVIALLFTGIFSLLMIVMAILKYLP
jgi:hypothetical protein